MRISLAWAIAISILGGCDFLKDPIAIEVPADRIIVHAMLEAGADSVTVYIQRGPTARTGSQGELGALPVPGAEVTLSGAGRSAILTEIEDWRCPLGSCYSGRIPGDVQPDEGYELRIETGEEPVVIGSLRVPALPELLAPAAGSPFEVDAESSSEPAATIPISFAAPGAESVEVTLTPTASFVGGEDEPTVECGISYGATGLLSDDAEPPRVIIFYPIRCLSTGDGGRRSIQVDSIHASLRISGFDRNYTEFARALSDDDDVVTPEEASAGIEGALGLFGSVATTAVEITLIPRTD